MSNKILYAQFKASKVGKTGLTVTCDVDKVARSDGTRTAVATGASATEGRRGWYFYIISSVDESLYDYVGVFITSDSTVDDKEIPSLRSDQVEQTGLVSAIWASATRTLTAISDSSGVTTLLARVGAFSGSGVNTILGVLKALASKAATLPSDIGGTFDPATDALEKISEQQTSSTDPLSNDVPGSYASGTAGYALGRIGAGTATVTQPVSALTGDVEITQGCDYNNSDGMALDFVNTDIPTLDITGATVNLYSALIDKAGSVVTATGATKKVRVELTAAETLAASDGSATYAIIVTLESGRKIVYGTGTITVSKQIT